MTRRRFISCLLAGLLSCASTVPVEARRDGRRDDRSDRSSRRDNRHRDGLSLDEAVARVRRDTGGRVLSAQERERDRGTTYRIKVLMPNATVRSFNVEAQDREGR